jgi:hypothetical protein
MAAEYQEPDWPVVDYQTYCLDERLIDPSRERALRVRGPRPERLEPGRYAVFLGAAQTFGRFCADPFPSLLGRRLGLPILNISHGGAGALFFRLMGEALTPYLSNAAFVVVQVMSGRSESNSLFESRGVGHYRRRSDGAWLGCDQAFAELLKDASPGLVASVLAETRASWAESHRHLLTGFGVPGVLFWFSTRHPDYDETTRSLDGLFGAYPQLVNAAMIRDIRRDAAAYVACVSKQGLPQPLVDRFTGRRIALSDPWTTRPWTENWYYPSPDMHRQAADTLEPVCRLLMKRAGERLA